MGVNARTSQKNAAWELLKFFTYDSVVYGGANLETTLKNLQREISNALTG